MWTCLKCRNENADTLTICSMCGALLGEKEKQTSLLFDDVLLELCTKISLPKPVGITRRFSVGTLLILMTFYAALFSGLKVLGLGPPIFAGITVFFTGVGLGQMLLSDGSEPRKASLCAGLIMGFISGFASLTVAYYFPGDNNIDRDEAIIFFMILCIFGCPLGYLAGGLIAGIFLFREREKQASAEVEEDVTS